MRWTRYAALWALAATLLACHRHAPAPSMPAIDAGASPAQHAPEPDPSSATAQGDAGAPKHRKVRARKPTTPPDPRVLGCTGGPYKDWPSVRDCILAEAPAGVADAGHKFGAVRPNVAANPSWLVPAWYVNASTGNDENTCTTSGLPCKTYGELVNRWGGYIVAFPQATTVTIAGNLPTGDVVTAIVPMTAAGSLTIQGTMVTVSSGSLAGVVSKNRATPQALNANLGTNASGAVGHFIENTSRVSGAWVDPIVTGNVVLLSQPLDDATDSAEVDTWANGDGYTVQAPSQITVGKLENIFIYQADVQPAFWTSLHNVYFERANLPVQTTVYDTYLANCRSNSLSLYAGAITGSSVTFARLYGFVDLSQDVSLHDTTLFDTGADVRFDYVYSDSIVSSGQLFIAGLAFSRAPGALWGPALINVQLGGTVLYSGSAVLAFAGAALSFDGSAVGNALDRHATPSQIYPNRALSPAALDLSIASGGFEGNALSPAMHSSISIEGLSTPVPSAYVAPVANGGTGDTSGAAHAVAVWEGTSPMAAVGGSCTGGNVLTCNSGADPSFQAPASAVSSVTGSSGVSCSPTTGAVVCTNTGVTSVTGSTGISCSPTTGAATCTNTSIVTWAGDDVGSTNSAQYVAAISGNAGGGSAVPLNTTSLLFAKGEGTPAYGQTGQTTDTATTFLTLRAQDAYSSASTNVNGGALYINGGESKSAGVTGRRGDVQLGVGYLSFSPGVQVTEPVLNQRVTALATFANAITSTQMPSSTGDGVVYLANAVTTPTANPVSGGIVYESGGAFEHRGTGGADEQTAGAGEGTINTQLGRRRRRVGFLRTVNSTLATILTYTMPASGNHIAYLEVAYACTNTTTLANSGAGRLVGNYSTNGTTATVIGTPFHVYDSNVTQAGIQFTPSGNTILVQVSTVSDCSAFLDVFEN